MFCRRAHTGAVVAALAGATHLTCAVDFAPLAQGGSGGTDAGSTGGGAGAAGATACAGYCAKIVAAGCDVTLTQSACDAACEDATDRYARCAPSWAAYVACATAAAFTCDGVWAVPTGCVLENEALSTCLWSFTPSCDVPPVAPSGGSCYATSACNPVTNQGCASGEACSFDGDVLKCFAGPLDQPICSTACDWEPPQDCAPGHECVPNASTWRCARFCCTDADCGGTPGSCLELGSGEVRFCGWY